MTDDMILVWKCVFGDPLQKEQGWRELIERYRPAMLESVRKIMRGRAEECVDDFLSLLCVSRLGAYLRPCKDGRQSKPNLKSYLCRGVRNHALRGFLRVGPGTGDDQAPIEWRQSFPRGTGRDETAWFCRALAELTPLRRLSFTLKFWNECLELCPDATAWCAEQLGVALVELERFFRETPNPSSEALARWAKVSVSSFYKHLERARRDLARRFEQAMDESGDEPRNKRA